MEEWTRKPPVPVFHHRRKSPPCPSLRPTQPYRSTDKSAIPTGTSDITLEGFSHMSVIRSLHASPSPPPRTRPLSAPSHHKKQSSAPITRPNSPPTCWKETPLSATEKKARRAMLVRMESLRVESQIEDKRVRQEERQRLRVERRERQNLQKVWMLTIAHMSRLG